MNHLYYQPSSPSSATSFAPPPSSFPPPAHPAVFAPSSVHHHLHQLHRRQQQIQQHQTFHHPVIHFPIPYQQTPPSFLPHHHSSPPCSNTTTLCPPFIQLPFSPLIPPVAAFHHQHINSNNLPYVSSPLPTRQQHLRPPPLQSHPSLLSSPSHHHRTASFSFHPPPSRSFVPPPVKEPPLLPLIRSLTPPPSRSTASSPVLVQPNLSNNLINITQQEQEQRKQQQHQSGLFLAAPPRTPILGSHLRQSPHSSTWSMESLLATPPPPPTFPPPLLQHHTDQQQRPAFAGQQKLLFALPPQHKAGNKHAWIEEGLDGLREEVVGGEFHKSRESNGEYRQDIIQMRQPEEKKDEQEERRRRVVSTGDIREEHTDVICGRTGGGSGTAVGPKTEVLDFSWGDPPRTGEKKDGEGKEEDRGVRVWTAARRSEEEVPLPPPTPSFGERKLSQSSQFPHTSLSSSKASSRRGCEEEKDKRQDAAAVSCEADTKDKARREWMDANNLFSATTNASGFECEQRQLNICSSPSPSSSLSDSDESSSGADTITATSQLQLFLPPNNISPKMLPSDIPRLQLPPSAHPLLPSSSSSSSCSSSPHSSASPSSPLDLSDDVVVMDEMVMSLRRRHRQSPADSLSYSISSSSSPSSPPVDGSPSCCPPSPLS
eukprot:GHVS01022829.1.p1 GENE.GHVS01022829.1~~GHVS01022829.1.p1  ORF type:complete len:657 (+),score=207.50 GHVS01022829.1:179-2149(+)